MAVTGLFAASAGRAAAQDSGPGAIVSPTEVPAPQPADQPTRATTQSVIISGQPATPTAAELHELAASRPSTTQISFDFANASVDAVLEHLSSDAGFVVLKDAGIGAIPGRVTVLSKQSVSPDEAVTLLNTVLKGNGYTAIRMGRILKIVTRDKAKKGDIPVHFGVDPAQIEPNDDLITQVIPVRSVDAVKLKTDLQPLINADADLASNGGSNTIIVTDTGANIRRLVEIIAALDRKDALENTIHVKQLKYADATAAAKLITDIFKTEDSSQTNVPGPFQFFRGFGGRGGGGPGGFGGPGGGGAGNNAQDEKGQTGKVVASADSRTNTVVVSGPADTLKVIDDVLMQLDADPTEVQAFFLYPLRNGDATKMAAVLNSLFGNTTSGTGNNSSNSRTNNSLNSSSSSSNRNSFGSSGSSGVGSNRSSGGGGSGGFGGSGGSTSGGFGGATINRNTNNNASAAGSNTSAAAASLQGQVYVVADVDTNSLLVNTATKYQQAVKDIIVQLDRPVAQVLIKALIAEVTHDNSEDLGVDFSVLNTRASGRGEQGSTGFGLPAAQGTPGSGLVVSYLEKNVSATLHALATAGKVDVLSRPYILASDNQEATITVGQEVPIITDSRLDINNNPVNEITYRDIGIILDVTPHINPDGLVIVDVSPEVSSISDQTVPISSNVSSPVFNLRSADSRVAIRNGETIVIGGLMQDQKTQTISKVPLLGDIPWLGTAFQRNITSKTKTELLIFLTPHVAQQPDKLHGMSADEMRGTKLTPNAVEPGTFQDHMRGLQRGATSQPADTDFVPPPSDTNPTRQSGVHN